MPQSPQHPGASHRPRGRLPSVLVLSVTLLLAPGLLAWAASPALGKAPKPGSTFTAVTAAWKAGSADRVADTIEVRGAATFQLLAYPLNGRARSMKPKQTRAALKAYFKRISGVKLVDVTPKRSPASVRLFDYIYKPAGENARTTRLHIQLKQDKGRRWVLASVTESRKPRS